MTGRAQRGMLDTSAVIDLPALDPARLPVEAAIPFDREAARRYGILVALAIAANRDPRPRRIDLMIAATAAAHGLPLYTRNPDDFRGLDSAVTVIAI